MSDWSDLGISMQTLFAGFCGSVVASFTLGKTRPIEIVSSTVVGTATAINLTDPVAVFMAAHVFDFGVKGTAFLIGLCGMGLTQGIIEGVRRFDFGSLIAKK